MGGLRPYYTSNVLRLNDNELSSGVLKPVRDFRYPQLRRRSAGISVCSAFGFSDAMGKLSGKLGQGFAKLSLWYGQSWFDFRFPHEWSLNFGLQYDFLHSQESV